MCCDAFVTCLFAVLGLVGPPLTRRRLYWIRQRDPGSILSRLPAHVLDEVVPYFDPAPRAAV